MTVVGSMEKDYLLTRYSYEFSFERNFQPTSVANWMQHNWTYAFHFCALYAIFILAGQHYMKHRQPYCLRSVLALWNFCLTAISASIFLRAYQEFNHTLQQHGLKGTICLQSFLDDRIFSFWSFVFVMSKIPELGDTMFIILRKQRLVFLHWYHHVTVLVYAFYACKEVTPNGRWFVLMNSFVHTFMYLYYALRAMRYRLPKIASIMLTSVQTLQMVVGCFINYLSYQYSSQNSTASKCPISMNNIKISTTVYATYFLLFTKFFYDSYLRNHPSCDGQHFQSNGTNKNRHVAAVAPNANVDDIITKKLLYNK